MIRNLVEWRPLTDPVEGYTVVMGCMGAMERVAIANLKAIGEQEADNLVELILVFDGPVEEVSRAVRDEIESHPLRDRIRLAGYGPIQYRVARLINWAWVYCWLSWVIAIGLVRSRAVIVHDLDAIPIRRDFFERLYLEWRESGAQFRGVRWYRGGGVTDEMGIPTTFELVLDAVHFRGNHRPFDAFNKTKLVGGKVVDFDTFLWVEWQAPGREIGPVEESELMHPSQLICDYMGVVTGRKALAGRGHSLAMLPYYHHLGGEDRALRQATAALADPSASSFPLDGRDLAVDGCSPAHWAWMEKLIRLAEHGLFGRVRPEVEAFLEPFARRAGKVVEAEVEVGVELGVRAEVGAELVELAA
ncbi:hypothetical protein [Paludisphaera sp.]|uniref:hypothetical protein n=1 Tax=Paludisphaera sp. TaxID=2017432 RepID=UPI00301C2CEB